MKTEEHEVRSLQRGLRDLVALTTLPAIWAGSQPHDIAKSLTDVLLTTLDLDLVYVFLKRMADPSFQEMVKTRQQLITGPEAQEIGTQFASLMKIDLAEPLFTVPDPLHKTGKMQIAVVPIGLDALDGFIVAGVRPGRDITELDRLLISVAANQAVTALQQAQLVIDLRIANQLKSNLLLKEQAARNEAEVTQRQMHFLAEASATLASTLEYEATLGHIMDLAVPVMADWGSIFLVDERSTLQHVKTAARTRDVYARVIQIQQHLPFDVNGLLGAAQVLRSGTSLFVPEIDRLSLKASAKNPALFDSIDALNPRSAIVVALQARGSILGILSLNLGESARTYDQQDLALAEELAHWIATAVDRARLYRAEQTAREHLQIRVRFQSLVADLGQQALMSNDLPRLINDAAVMLTQTLDVQYTKILEYRPEENRLLLVAGTGWEEGVVGNTFLSAGLESQSGYTLEARQPVIVEDLRTETRFQGPPLLMDHGVISGMGVIIQSHEHPWGVLSAHTTRHRIFTPDDIYFLQSVANVLGAALERERLYKAEQTAREHLQIRVRFQSLVADLGQQALVDNHLPNLMSDAAEMLTQALDVQYTKILEYRPDENRLLLVSGTGWEDGVVGQTFLSAGLESQAGYTLEARQPVIVEDLRTETRFHGPPLLMDHGVISGMGVIVQGHERPWGVLSVHTTSRRIFTPDDIYFLQSVANVLGAALERDRWYKQAQDSATLNERHRIARELHDAVSQTLFAANLMAETLPGLWERNPVKARERTQQLHQLTRGSSAEMRVLLAELRPESVINANLGDLLTQLGYAMPGRKDIDVSVIVRGKHESPLPADVQMAFYRIAQESLNNIIKHGQAKQARIRLLRTKDQTILIVTDNGSGFDVTSSRSGLGLKSMSERAGSIGATFDVRSKVGRGTQIKVVWNAPEENVIPA